MMMMLDMPYLLSCCFASSLQEQIELYKERQKAIDVNPIKKVAEAAARKKKRV